MIRFALGGLAVALLSASPFADSLHGSSRLAGSTLGPPWISIEHPVNPYDATTRDAFLLVHAFHHGTPMNFPVTGTAEGYVDGARKTVNLEFRRTSRSGVYALARQWDSKGEWTLVVSVSQGANDKVSAVVDLTRGGEAVASVHVPTRTQGTHRIPAAVAMHDIESALRTRAGKLASKQ